MKIGFIGVGVIAVSVVHALEAVHGNEIEIYLSPRNAEKAAKLASQYSNVKIMENNQEVIDNSEWVFVALLSKDMQAVMENLRFRKINHIVSLVPDCKLEQIKIWANDCQSITRFVPLPFIEYQRGPLVIYPKNDSLEKLLNGTGDLIVLDEEAQFAVVISLTSTMGPYYYLISKLSEWAVEKGVSNNFSSNFLVSYFEALAFKAKSEIELGLDTLWKDMTPGGFNETAIRDIEKKGGFNSWEEALDSLLEKQE